MEKIAPQDTARTSEDFTSKPRIIEFGPGSESLMNKFLPGSVDTYTGLDWRKSEPHEIKRKLHLAEEPTLDGPISSVGIANLTDEAFLEGTSFDNEADMVVLFNVFSRLRHPNDIKEDLPTSEIMEKLWNKLRRLVRHNGAVFIGEWYTPGDVHSLLAIDFKTFGFKPTLIQGNVANDALEKSMSSLKIRPELYKKISARWQEQLQFAKSQRTLGEKLRFKRFSEKDLPFLLVLQRVD